MSKTILCTVSDDRSGRKGGQYQSTQDKVCKIFIQNRVFDEQHHWNINQIINSTKTEEPEINSFYQANKVMLDNPDAAINGRLYKPFVILQSLKKMNDGDYLIYNDVSPEMWTMNERFFFNPDIYDIEVIKELCRRSNDLLVAFVKWAPENFDKYPLGIHTHHYFTLEPCINAMGAEKYRDSYLCASGMICIRKTHETMQIIREWIYWNEMWECASIGNPEIPGDESLWNNREDYKLGCRHDQSILSILLNKRNWNFVDIVYNHISPYNFLNFCRKDHDYKFINSNIKP
jgi:hypothetical protein